MDLSPLFHGLFRTKELFLSVKHNIRSKVSMSDYIRLVAIRG